MLDVSGMSILKKGHQTVYDFVLTLETEELYT